MTSLDSINPLFKEGDKVKKLGSDYIFEGTVVAVFRKLSKQIRYVIEDDRGIIYICDYKNLELVADLTEEQQS